VRSQDQPAPLPDASPFRFAVIVSRFNEAITGSLRDAAVAALKEAGASEANVHVFTVPGAYEIPQAAGSPPRTAASTPSSVSAASSAARRRTSTTSPLPSRTASPRRPEIPASRWRSAC